VIGFVNEPSTPREEVHFQRDDLAVLGFHAMHELEHVARHAAAAGVAVEDTPLEVDRTARSLVVVERTAHLGLLTLSEQR
jgi:hypothetical protein